MEKSVKITIGILSLAVIYTVLQRFNSNPKVWYRDLAKNKPSKTIFPFGIIINNSNPETTTIKNGEVLFGKDAILKHEMTHWNQIRKNGLLLFKLKNMNYNKKYGYFNNPFEKEAYIATDQ